MTYRALICGLGRVGWSGFAESPSAETHYAALSQHPRIKLVGGVDPDDATRHSFQEATSLLVYPDISTALQDASADIVVVSSPPATHAALVCTIALVDSVRAILCEKPMALTVDDCSRMAVSCYRKGKVLLIGHQRRYEQNHRLLRAFLKSEVMGKTLGGRCTFPGDDWLNNGTHAADTMRFLLGDLPYSIRLGKENTRKFSCMIYSEYGQVMLESYKHMVPGYRRAMIDDLIECIETDKKPECSADDGLEAVRATLAAEEMWKDEAA